MSKSLQRASSIIQKMDPEKAQLAKHSVSFILAYMAGVSGASTRINETLEAVQILHSRMRVGSAAYSCKCSRSCVASILSGNCPTTNIEMLAINRLLFLSLARDKWKFVSREATRLAVSFMFSLASIKLNCRLFARPSSAASESYFYERLQLPKRIYDLAVSQARQRLMPSRRPEYDAFNLVVLRILARLWVSIIHFSCR